MGLFILELLFEGLRIRGHVPRFENDPPRIEPSLSANGGAWARAVAAVLATALFLGVGLWIVVWLVLKLL